jgi:micrococcal nuclease
MTPHAFRPFTRRAFFFTAGLLIVLGGATHGDEGVSGVLVSRVADGDTIQVELGGRETTIRLIGVDTPELGDRHDRSAPPQPFAREAADFTRRTLKGQRVRLEFESGDRLDRYGRTLAYVFLVDGTFFNRELLRGGFARAYTRFPFRYRDQFRSDEAAARQAQLGLWAPTARAVAGPVIANRRSGLYHLPGQPHYGEVAERNRVYFGNEAAARAAGYERALR